MGLHFQRLQLRLSHFPPCRGQARHACKPAALIVSVNHGTNICSYVNMTCVPLPSTCTLIERTAATRPALVSHHLLTMGCHGGFSHPPTPQAGTEPSNSDKQLRYNLASPLSDGRGCWARSAMADTIAARPPAILPAASRACRSTTCKEREAGLNTRTCRQTAACMTLDAEDSCAERMCLVPSGAHATAF